MWVKKNALGKSAQDRKTPIKDSEEYDIKGGEVQKRTTLLEEMVERVPCTKEEEEGLLDDRK